MYSTSESPAQLRRLRLYQVIAAIPAGKVASYGQLAALAECPGAARWVGYCLRHLPRDTQLPWHRVITASGTLAFAPDTDAYLRQSRLLAAESIQVHNHRVNMRQYQWDTMQTPG